MHKIMLCWNRKIAILRVVLFLEIFFQQCKRREVIQRSYPMPSMIVSLSIDMEQDNNSQVTHIIVA
ncbi:hypothetical protein HMPREF9244_00163 [Alloscardovia omnicolens F0580]|uniref:Uncharacterized protein n=1 Tax=Alloscardovia omnicolens F0580 TaxID=1321816 RepID=U1RCF8_9BIFI|nr:hypothetical protein HMPREF9244_00163 [Alloscardovia omnicolens F0580]